MQLLNLSEQELNDIEITLKKWVQTWSTSKNLGLDNTLHLLANMYSLCRKISSGEKPYVEPEDVASFGNALQQLKQAIPHNAELTKYYFVLPALQKAYTKVGEYAISLQEATLQITKDTRPNLETRLQEMLDIAESIKRGEKPKVLFLDIKKFFATLEEYLDLGTTHPIRKKYSDVVAVVTTYQTITGYFSSTMPITTLQ